MFLSYFRRASRQGKTQVRKDTSSYLADRHPRLSSLPSLHVAMSCTVIESCSSDWRGDGGWLTGPACPNPVSQFLSWCYPHRVTGSYSSRGSSANTTFLHYSSSYSTSLCVLCIIIFPILSTRGLTVAHGAQVSASIALFHV